MNKKSIKNPLQSKALDLITSLNSKEFLQFGKYLETFFVSNKNLKKLFVYLRKFYPDFGNSKLTKSGIYNSVYSDSVLYSDIKTRKLLSDLYKEAENFIAIQHLKKDKLVYDKILLDEFDTRMLDNLFTAKYEELNGFLDSEGAHLYQFLEKHIIEWIYISFHLERGTQQKIALNIYKRAEYIIYYFLSDMFTTLQDINANILRYNISKKENLAEELISCLDTKKLFSYIEKNFPDSILLRIYYLSFNAFKHFENEKLYFELKKFVNNNLGSLHENSKRAAISFLINYCIRKVSVNRNKFDHELNDNYSTYIKNNLYKVSGENYLRIDLFLHILGNYFKTGMINQAAEFLNGNINIIQPIHRTNMLTLCNALIEFEMGNFNDSLRYASQLKQNTKLYRDTLKIIILKNNFELGNYDVALEITANYRRSIEKSESMPGFIKEKILNFLVYFYKLLKLHNSKPSEQAAIQLLSEVKADVNLQESKWLSKKIEELIRK